MLNTVAVASNTHIYELKLFTIFIQIGLFYKLIDFQMYQATHFYCLYSFLPCPSDVTSIPSMYLDN